MNVFDLTLVCMSSPSASSWEKQWHSHIDYCKGTDPQLAQGAAELSGCLGLSGH